MPASAHLAHPSVGTAGLEPATPGPPDRCATRLRHVPCIRECIGCHAVPAYLVWSGLGMRESSARPPRAVSNANGHPLEMELAPEPTLDVPAVRGIGLVGAAEDHERRRAGRDLSGVMQRAGPARRGTFTLRSLDHVVDLR